MKLKQQAHGEGLPENKAFHFFIIKRPDENADHLTMKKSIFIITALMCFSALVYAGIGYDGFISSETGTDAVNNSMIIGGLIMDEPVDESSPDPGSGGILYDEFFGEALIDFTDHKKEELASLRKKDSRWHLVEYRVKKRDSISTLSVRSGVPSKVLCSINNIYDENLLREGSNIFLPSRAGIDHVIKKGETPVSIAKKYHAKSNIIIKHNNIKNGKLIAGSKIFIPGGKKPAPVSDIRNIALINEKGRSKGFSLMWPLRGRITSGFGMRTDPFIKKRRFHNGIDISAAPGTSVAAAADGTVIFSGWKAGYGNMVVLSHNNKYLTVYAHNSKNSVEEKQSVKKGETIALSGMTGAVTGAHLHFEFRKIDHLTPLNPMRFFK
jgi:murein DD-endopeptidase MepM/ murein hydrolase activator NlpD